MKILIIVNNILDPYLGPSVVANNLMKGFTQIQDELEKNNVKITFLSINDKVSKIITNNIKIINAMRNPPLTITGEIQSMLKRPSNEFDVVHSQLLYDLPIYAFRNDTIFTLHGIFWEETKYTVNPYMKFYYFMATTRLKLYYPRLKCLVAVSPYVRDQLEKKGFNVKKVVVIGNPIADDFFQIKKIEDENLIIFPSKITARKNQLGFLKAVKIIKDELKDYKIIFSGSYDTKYYEILRNFIKKYNLKIEFTGRLSYQQILQLYSKASMMVLPSFEETFSMVTLESMATGTPAIVSDIPALRTLIDDGKEGFLIDPNDPKQIGEKILLLKDKKLRNKLGKNAKVKAENYRAKLIAKKHLYLYLKLKDY